MKLCVNYDLLDQIELANHGLKLRKIAKYSGKVQIVMVSVNTFVELAISHKVLWAYNLLLASIGFIAMTTTLALIMEILKDIVKTKANAKLAKLSLDLTSLNVYTTPELLKDYQLVKTNYKFQVNDKKLPVLKQEKYIKIPTINKMGKQYEETLYQEHVLGSENYEISVKEPKKKVQVKRKLAMQI